MRERIVVDLTEDIHTYTGGVPEDIWRTAPEFNEFGTPEHLAFSAVQILCDYTGYWNDFERYHGKMLTTRREYLGVDDMALNCWDLYFQSVFHLLGQTVLPHLQQRPSLYIDDYDFRNNALFVTLSDEQGRKPSYLMNVEAPKD